MQMFALWCHPRSISTAFERIMRERGDLDVLHEPFMYEYYLQQSHHRFADFNPEPDHPCTYQDIRDMILERAQSNQVFFKDMAYYLYRLLPQDHEFSARIQHCFLIRRPEESILSYQQRDPEFSREEVGLEAQWILYQSLLADGQQPLVIRASDLRDEPQATMSHYWQWAGLSVKPEALAWQPTVPRGWQSVKQWHTDAITSGAIRPTDRQRDYESEIADLGPPYTDYLIHHRPFYDALAEVAISQFSR